MVDSMLSGYMNCDHCSNAAPIELDDGYEYECIERGTVKGNPSRPCNHFKQGAPFSAVMALERAKRNILFRHLQNVTDNCK